MPTLSPPTFKPLRDVPPWYRFRQSGLRMAWYTLGLLMGVLIGLPGWWPFDAIPGQVWALLAALGAYAIGMLVLAVVQRRRQPGRGPLNITVTIGPADGAPAEAVATAVRRATGVRPSGTPRDGA